MVRQRILPFLGMSLLFFCLAAIAQDAKRQQTLMEEVIEAHDQVMDRMPELAKLIGKLENKADVSNEKQKYRDAVKELKAANKSMMDWMAGFGYRFEADEMYKGKTLSEQKQKWLLEEKKNIADLREEVSLSIEKGEQLLRE